MTSQSPSHFHLATRRAEKRRRLACVASIADGVVLPTDRVVDVLQSLIAPGDRVDLTPNVVLVAGYKADHDGNLYTCPSTEDTPALADIPGSWIDFVVQADKPFFIEPLFTRDPRLITPIHVLMAMMAISVIYERHQVQSLNHGIGFNTAAIELILPTYSEKLGLKGKICRHWTLNPHPTLIPAIETALNSTHTTARRSCSTKARSANCSIRSSASARCGSRASAS